MILGYARCSTLEQAAPGKTTLETQQEAIQVLARSRGHKIMDIAMFVDAGVSGSVPLGKRPAGSKLLASIAEGDIVVSTKLDRLFRSAIDALLIRDQIKQKGAHLIMLDFGTDPITGTGMAAAQFGIMAVIAEWERQRIAERITEGRRAKVARGGHGGGRAPYGYRIVGSGRDARLEQDDAEAPILAVVAEMTREHWRAGKIKRTLAAKGLTTRNGKPFAEVQVKRLMQRVAMN